MAVTPEELRIRISAQNDASKPISEVRKDLAWLGTGAKQTQKAVMGTNTAISGMGRQMGMAGIQVQQLVGQIQGGTSAFVAFSQQAADLGFVLGFPLLGAVVGIASAFAGPLVAAIMGVEETTRDLNKEVQELASNYDNLTDAQKRYYDMIAGEKAKNMRLELNSLQNQYESISNQLKSPIDWFASEDRRQKFKELNADLIRLASDIDSKKKEIDEIMNPSTSGYRGQELIQYSKDIQDNMSLVFEKELERRKKAAEKAAKDQEEAERDLQAVFQQLQEDRTAKELAARKYSLDVQDNFTKLFLEKQQNAQKEYEAMLKSSMEHLKPIEDGLVNLINGSKDVSSSFSDMARSIINDLIRIQIQQSITKPLANMMTNAGGLGGIMSSVGSFLGFEGGGYTGAGARSGGVDGRGGFPAILHPNETVVDHTQGQTGGVTINQTINVTTGVQQTVRTEIASLMPQIAAASKQAVLDARKRGGSFGSAFGA